MTCQLQATVRWHHSFFDSAKPHQRHRWLKKTRQGLKAVNSWKEVSAWSCCSQCQIYEDLFFYLEDNKVARNKNLNTCSGVCIRWAGPISQKMPTKIVCFLFEHPRLMIKNVLRLEGDRWYQSRWSRVEGRLFFGWSPNPEATLLKFDVRIGCCYCSWCQTGGKPYFFSDGHPAVALVKFDVRIGCCYCSWCQTVLLTEVDVRVGEVRKMVEGMVEIFIGVKQLCFWRKKCGVSAAFSAEPGV